MKLSALVGLTLAALVAGILPGHGQTRPAAAFDSNPSAVRAGTYALDSDHGKITWSVSHFGLSRYQGQFVGVTGRLTLDPKAPEQATLQITVPLDRVGTFHAGLDAHLRNADFFDVPNHPTATFASTRIERLGERQARVHGNLTLRGVTKPVTFVGTFNTAGVHPVTRRYTIGFDGEATVRRTEFGVSYGVPAVSDEVQLALGVEFQLLE
jgi:polyisoprenoid-binding protein YceI